MVGTLDNVIRPMLIRMGADLPLILILWRYWWFDCFRDDRSVYWSGSVSRFWRLFAAWVEEVPPPTDQPEEILEELGEIEKPNK